MTDNPGGLYPKGNATKQQYLSEFNLEHQFKLYLEIRNLDIRKLTPDRLKETRKAFYYGMGQLINLLHDNRRKACTELEVYAMVQAMSMEIAEFVSGKTLKQSPPLSNIGGEQSEEH